MKPPTPRTRTAAAGSIARRIGAGAALAILLFGVPFALAVFIGWPAPSKPPTLDEARQWLTASITDRAIIDALAVLLWYLWAQFVRCLIAETRAARTGATARRLRGTAGTQQLAATIITTLTMGIVVTTAVAPAAIGLTPLEPTVAAHTATRISETATPIAPDGTERARTGESDPARTESTAYITIRIGAASYRHPVTAGDDLSTIAEQWLGNADRWPEIHALNRAAFTPTNAGAGGAQPAALNPGSTIVLPRDARPPSWTRLAQTVNDSATGRSAVPAKPEYTVARGDWVYHIAARFLGDGDRYPEIARLNNNLERADRRFPDHIEPGQLLTLPPSARDRGPQPHANGSATSTAPPRPPRPKAETFPRQPPPTALPSSEATNPDRAAPPSPSVKTGSSPDSDDSTGVLDTVLPTTAVLACAGMLAALALYQLRAARRRQRQQRQPNRRIPSAPDPTIETTVRASARPADVDRLNEALRNLAAGLHDHMPADLPDVAAVSISAGDIDFILTHPNPHPPSPFVTDQSGRTWSLPRSVPLADDDQALAPLPLLATVASSPDGHHLLIDLERAHLVTISGDRRRATDLLRYLAAELATSHWSDDTQIVLAGFDHDDARHLAALGGDRVTTATSIAEAIARVQRRAAATITAMTDTGLHAALEGRIADLIADALMPHVLLIADANGHEDASSLAGGSPSHTARS
ncbi:LysM peptidoglycan-binding domain-containing protein [Phytohabitans houttuyneae]|uniref:LysM domain-containing protein n=1 Tax=Phytohabitans houttuyneae TaxID=1076126 RepID=A0A6V8KL39_9ACTN|nr:LysM peptidoglycan-binding domain-containing protein [Phytohabitans houttuyneae]GFJ85813.1 hypothetical protein Phou_099930 [Phytohabitans houttuyneae]